MDVPGKTNTRCSSVQYGGLSQCSSPSHSLASASAAKIRNFAVVLRVLDGGSEVRNLRRHFHDGLEGRSSRPKLGRSQVVARLVRGVRLLKIVVENFIAKRLHEFVFRRQLLEEGSVDGKVRDSASRLPAKALLLTDNDPKIKDFQLVQGIPSIATKNS